VEFEVGGFGFGVKGEFYPTEDPKWFSRIAFISSVKTDPLVRYSLIQRSVYACGPISLAKHVIHRLENCGLFIGAVADLIMRLVTTIFVGLCCALSFGSITWLNETLRDHSHILALAPFSMIKAGIGIISLRAEEELFKGIRQSYVEEVAKPYWKIVVNFYSPFS